MSVISFITLSRTPEKVESLKRSLKRCFAGAAMDFLSYELIVVDGTKYDLYQGYDEGASQAKGEALAFIHDDTELLAHYGCFLPVLELLAKPFTGIVGAAGSTLMPPEGCWWKVDQEKLRGLVYHSNRGSKFGMHGNAWPWQCAKFDRVAVVDGVCMVLSRKAFDTIGGFVATGGQGFHFYDMRLAMKGNNRGLTHWVAPIPILHQSPGKPDESYEEAREKFVKDFQKHLPYEISS
jgi:hypothetical protein